MQTLGRGTISCLKGKWEMGGRVGGREESFLDRGPAGSSFWLGCGGGGDGNAGPQPGCGVQFGVQTPYSLYPLESPLNSWGLSFLIHKMGVRIAPASKTPCEDEVNPWKALETAPGTRSGLRACQPLLSRTRPRAETWSNALSKCRFLLFPAFPSFCMQN